MSWAAEERQFIDYVVSSWEDPRQYRYLSALARRDIGSAPHNGTLKDASEKYLWRNESFADAMERTTQMSANLLVAPSEVNACHALHHQCLTILEWGGLPGVSSKWLREMCDRQKLRAKINSAVTALTSGSQLEQFDGVELPMNSGMTKIYALAAPDHLIIYDGRVGAALGLLARRSIFGGQGEVPQSLRFPWGSGQGKYTQRAVSRRNPSLNGLTFPYFDDKDQSHAVWCHQASRLLREVRSQLSSGVTLRQIEMGLFMVGYAVNGLE